MPPSLDPTAAQASDRRRQHRRRLIAALIVICRRVGRLDVSEDGRQASREVEQSLQALLDQQARRKRLGGRC